VPNNDIKNDFMPITNNIKKIRENFEKSADSVLKHTQVRYGNSLKINAFMNQNMQKNEERVEPILEDGLIVGLKYYCRCGNVAEISFVLDRESNE